MSLIFQGLEQKAKDYIKYAGDRLYEKLLIESEIDTWINDLASAGDIFFTQQQWTSDNTIEIRFRPSDDPHFLGQLSMTFDHLPCGTTKVSTDDAYDRAMRGI